MGQIMPVRTWAAYSVPGRARDSASGQNAHVNAGSQPSQRPVISVEGLQHARQYADHCTGLIPCQGHSDLPVAGLSLVTGPTRLTPLLPGIGHLGLLASSSGLSGPPPPNSLGAATAWNVASPGEGGYTMGSDT